MDAANPLCRIPLLAALILALVGCKSDALAPKPRGQMPQEPLGPVVPPPPPDLRPQAPILPASAPPKAVTGESVAPQVGPIQKTSFTAPKALGNPADILKNSTPRVKVVAIVGQNNVITDKEVMESVWQQYHELAALSGAEHESKQRELYTKALRKLIERELVLDEMYSKLKKANKLNVIDEVREMSVQAADRQIRQIKKTTQVQTDEEFVAWLRVQGLTLPVLRRQFERQVMAQQYVSTILKEKGRRVGLAEIRDYYDSHSEEFKTPDRAKWQHIFVSVAKHQTPQAAYAHADAIIKSAAAGNDFAALSQQYDEGFAKMQKGFGLGESRGKIQPPELEATVWSMKAGQMSGVLQTATGYHIVKVVERDYAGVKPFDAAVQNAIRDKLLDSITEAEMKKLVDELWRSGVVRVMEE